MSLLVLKMRSSLTYLCLCADDMPELRFQARGPHALPQMRQEERPSMMHFVASMLDSAAKQLDVVGGVPANPGDRRCNPLIYGCPAAGAKKSHPESPHLLMLVHHPPLQKVWHGIKQSHTPVLSLQSSLQPHSCLSENPQVIHTPLDSVLLGPGILLLPIFAT